MVKKTKQNKCKLPLTWADEASSSVQFGVFLCTMKGKAFGLKTLLRAFVSSLGRNKTNNHAGFVRNTLQVPV